MVIELNLIKDYVENNLNCNLQTKRRKRGDAYARSVYYKIAREHTFKPLAEIGMLVSRDHATVLHGLNLFDQAILYDPKIKKLYDAFKLGVKLSGVKKFSSEIISIKQLLEDNATLKEQVLDLNIKLGVKWVDEKHDVNTPIGRLYNLIDTVTVGKEEVLYTRVSAIIKMI